MSRIAGVSFLILFSSSFLSCNSSDNSSANCSPGSEGSGYLPDCLQGVWIELINGADWTIEKKTNFGHAAYKWKVIDKDLIVLTGEKYGYILGQSNNDLFSGMPLEAKTFSRTLTRKVIAKPKITGVLLSNTGTPKNSLSKNATAIGGIDVILQSINNPSITVTTTTDDNGEFTFSDESLTSGSDYVISGTSTNSSTGEIASIEYILSLVQSHTSLGDLTLEAPGEYNLKVSLYMVVPVGNSQSVYLDNNLIFSGDSHAIGFIIENIGDTTAANISLQIDGSNDPHVSGGLVATIDSLAPGEIVGDAAVISQLALTTQQGILGAGSQTQAVFGFGQVEGDLPSAEYNALISVGMSDTGGKTASDTLTVAAYNQKGRLYMNREFDSHLYYQPGNYNLLYPWVTVIYPERRIAFLDTYINLPTANGAITLDIPVIPGEFVYLLLYKGPATEGDWLHPETSYALGLGTEQLLQTLTVDSYEPNNSFPSATVVQWGSGINAYLSNNDYDIYKVEFPLP